MTGKRKQDSLGGGTRDIIMQKKNCKIFGNNCTQRKEVEVMLKGLEARNLVPLFFLVTFLVASELSYLSEH